MLNVFMVLINPKVPLANTRRIQTNVEANKK